MRRSHASPRVGHLQRPSAGTSSHILDHHSSQSPSGKSLFANLAVPIGVVVDLLSKQQSYASKPASTPWCLGRAHQSLPLLCRCRPAATAGMSWGGAWGLLFCCPHWIACILRTKVTDEESVMGDQMFAIVGSWSWGGEACRGDAGTRKCSSYG